ncbi:MAG: hypothetical protein EBR10_07100 [Planctomycetes bacterium]|nr:hypothetical protein [Planctomycetota bacterium]
MTLDSSAAAASQVERLQEVRLLFERVRDRPRNEWHAVLSAALPHDPALAYEVLSLLVADESVIESQDQS